MLSGFYWFRIFIYRPFCDRLGLMTNTLLLGNYEIKMTVGAIESNEDRTGPSAYNAMTLPQPT